MEKSKLYQWIVPGLVLIVLVLLINFEQSKEKVLGAWGNAFRAISVNYITTVGMDNDGGAGVASSTQVLAANVDRVYARCYNTSQNGLPVSLMLGSTATSATLFSGIILSPVSSSSPLLLELNDDNQFTGAIYAYAQSTSTVACTEN